MPWPKNNCTWVGCFFSLLYLPLILRVSPSNLGKTLVFWCRLCQKQNYYWLQVGLKAYNSLLRKQCVWSEGNVTIPRASCRAQKPLKPENLVVQHCDPPYRAIGYSYTYRIYVFQCIAGYRAIPPPPFSGHRKIMLRGGGGGVRAVWGGGYRSSSLPSAL